MNVLFICSRNRKRSPTAEAIFSDFPGVEVSSAGTSVDAENAVSADQIDWADVIFVMEQVHGRRLQERFATVLERKKLVVLRIPDNYESMDKELIELLRRRVAPFLSK